MYFRLIAVFNDLSSSLKHANRAPHERYHLSLYLKELGSKQTGFDKIWNNTSIFLLVSVPDKSSFTVLRLQKFHARKYF
jgi:hypothetical protein